MAGFSVEEPYFGERLKENVSILMKALKDPALPLLELQVRTGRHSIFVTQPNDPLFCVIGM